MLRKNKILDINHQKGALKFRLIVSIVLFSAVGYLIGIFLMYNDHEIKGLFNYLDKRLILFFIPVANTAGFMCDYLLFRLNKILPWQKSMLIRFSTGYVATLLLTILVALVSKAILNTILEIPIKVWKSEVQLQLLIKLTIILAFVLFIYNLIHLTLYSYQVFFINSLKLKRIQSEQMHLHIEALKNQLTPHYLFNNLNAISTLVHQEKKKAEKFIRYFVNSCRFIIDNSRNILIPVNQELEFARSYFFLMNIRFPDMLDLDVKIPDDIMGSYVPPLSLQMLIENAIKHNFLKSGNLLKIRIYNIDKDYLAVENNITTEQEDKNPGNQVLKNGARPKSTKLGIKNLESRYSYLTDKPVIVEKTSIFSVKLPLIKSMV